MRRYCAIILTLFCGLARAEEAGVNRVLRYIDFEERRLGNPEELPMHWTKVEGPGMPHYLGGKLATDRHRGGKYSFRFDLNGGSVVYRYNPGQIHVQPQSHYRVEAFVQTTVLAHAKARLTAYFVDADKRPIPSSVHHSALYAAKEADEGWKKLEVELSTGSLSGSLVIELELLQPELYMATTLGALALFPQDIRGSAWFEDVSISQVPKVKMTTDRPGNIFRRGETLAMSVVVSDRSTDDLAAQLVIKDAAGKVAYQRSGAMDIAGAEVLGPGVKRTRLVLPELPAGWYEAGLVMSSRGQYVGRQQIDLVLLADSTAVVLPDERFGIIATDLPFDGWAELPQILPFLAAGRVKLAVWSKAGDIHGVDSAGFDQLLVRLQELRITPTACLIDLPPSVSRKMGGEAWSQILTGRTEDWQPQLAYMVSRHANHLDRWQLGADESEAFVKDPAMRRVYDRVYGEFARLVQKPDLAMPWPAWYEMQGELPATVAMSVPPSVLPHQLPLYMQDINKHKGHNLSLTLQLLDKQRYGREQQIRDLAQRVVYALTAGATRIDVPLPFTVLRDGEDLVKQPQELLMILRTLTTTLGGTTYKGKVPIAEGVEAFLFDKNGQGILAIWDRGQQGTQRRLALTLGAAPRMVDLWGNVTPLPRPKTASGADPQIQLTIGPMPVFLIDIDGQLAQLRSSVAFDRPLIESSFRPHTRKIRFVNPYRVAIAGTLKLKGPTGWTLNPPVSNFNVNPGETFERDVVIEFPYNSFAGRKIVEAEFHLQDSQIASTTVPITLNLGLSDVGMQTMAVLDNDTVLVQQILTNYGEKSIDYTAFAVFPGHARQERLVTNLAPGRSTIKLYRFAYTKGQGSRVRTGVKELMGTRILNDEVEIQ